MHRYVIAPAIIAQEWDDLVSQIEKVANVASDIHVDVMDGHLVPSFSFPYNKTILEGQKLPHLDTVCYEAHLMVQHPQEVGLRFINAGASRVTAQIKGFRAGEALRVCSEWRDAGAKVGISLMLDAPLESIAELVESGVVDLLQVMSIKRVGYQHEPFDERAFIRIRTLRERYPDVTLAVDGGVKAENLKPLRDAGIDRFCIGSAIMKTNDPVQSYKQLQGLLDSYVQGRL